MDFWTALAFKLITSCLTFVEPMITLSVHAEPDTDRDGLTQVEVTLKWSGQMPVGHAACIAAGIEDEGFYTEDP